MDASAETEAIRQLKYRYFRHLDCKQFDAMMELFADDSTTSYDNGRHACTGKAAIRAFFDKGLADPGVLSQHHGHHPEITLLDVSRATGVWYMDDTVLMPAQRRRIRGNGIYWDEYLKVDGQWKILHTGYERIWETQEVLPDDWNIRVRSMFEEKERTRSRERTRRSNEPDLLSHATAPGD